MRLYALLPPAKAKTAHSFCAMVCEQTLQVAGHGPRIETKIPAVSAGLDVPSLISIFSAAETNASGEGGVSLSGLSLSKNQDSPSVSPAAVVLPSTSEAPLVPSRPPCC